MRILAFALASSALVCAVSSPAGAQAQALDFQIPAGNLETALDAYARQARVQLLYQAAQVASARSHGATGEMTPEDALTSILRGSGFHSERDVSGAIAIVPAATIKPISHVVPAATSVHAQPAAPAPQPVRLSAGEEIIVTARKRAETAIAVPVVLSAVSGVEIERRGITNIDGIARLVPQMVTGEAGGIIGGNITIRGISGADSNPFGEQAVTFNVDGVQVARATVRRMAEMDLAQVEVLKGPQALFFGKNSPGGIISIRTADPTPNFEAKGSVGYEFNAHEWRTEGYVSGPITNDLGIRVAGYFSDMRGWATNTAPQTGIFAPRDRHLPDARNYGGRLTLKWEPADTFSARLKFGYMKTSDSGIGSNNQIVACPYGAPQFGGSTDCKGDDKVTRADLGPNFANVHPIFGDGVPYFRQEQIISSLELQYDLSDEVQLVSVSGLYDLNARILDNYTATATPERILASRGRYNITEVSEELRLQTSYEGPLNFLAGGHFQHAKLSNGTVVAVNGLNPVLANDYFLRMKGTSWSAFAQLSYMPVEVVEIAVGGRYSYERKHLTEITHFDTAVPVMFPRKNNWNDFSPEVTVTYRPNEDLTLFGAYKRGFLSGGFNAGASNFNSDLSYDQQSIKGFEAGVKAALLNRSLRANFAIYKYDISGLQISTLVIENNVPIQSISNAGKVGIKGAEFDFNYQTPLEGLQIHGAVAYNRARYKLYNAACYRGQSQAQGCNLGIGPNGLGTLQNLAGASLPRAPEWAGNAGFNYEHDIGSQLKFGLSGAMSFSSSYVGDTKSQPFDRQKSYQLFDATARVAAADDRWEVALIGRNLGNKYYHSRGGENPFTGTPGGGLNPGVLADTAAVLNRGREVMLRLTLRTGR